MLNAPNIKCCASEKISQWKGSATNTAMIQKCRWAVEMWRYNPCKLSNGSVVDELSLALAGERMQMNVSKKQKKCLTICGGG